MPFLTNLTFIPEWTIFVQFAIATAILSITPGPDIVIHTSMVALGLSALIVASPAAFTALKVVGAGYLVWLAVQAICKGSAFSPEKNGGKKHTLFQNWLTGLGINLLNPKIILFNMTFLPQFVSAHDPHAMGKLPFTIPMVVAADRFAGLLNKNPTVTRIVDWMFAGVFSAFALKIITAQAK